VKVLVACEMSGVVRRAFRNLGHEAWSCDLVPSMDDSLYHIQDDAIKTLKADKWDLVIAHPPCQYLSNSGVRWLYNKDGSSNLNRWCEVYDAANLFRAFFTEYQGKLCVENPVMHSYARSYIEYVTGGVKRQTIQPYQFGHPESKATVLWLRDLSPLVPTNILSKPARGYWDNQTPSGQNKLGPSVKRAELRAITYEGIAEAMAKQWGI
jgi:hypothetical protein